jgi:hypothetical protein
MHLPIYDRQQQPNKNSSQWTRAKPKFSTTKKDIEDYISRRTGEQLLSSRPTCPRFPADFA